MLCGMTLAKEGLRFVCENLREREREREKGRKKNNNPYFNFSINLIGK